MLGTLTIAICLSHSYVPLALPLLTLSVKFYDEPVCQLNLSNLILQSCASCHAACTAKRATSRTPFRTSSGQYQRAVEVQTTTSCSLGGPHGAELSAQGAPT